MNRFLLISVLALAITACQTPGIDTSDVASETPVRTVADTESDRAAITQITETWEAGARAGDAAAITALYADDAVILPGDQPSVRGREALAAYFTANYSAPADISITSGEIVVMPSGHFAYEVGASSAPNGMGKYLTVYRNTGGGWEIAADSWSNDAPTPATD